MSLSSDQTPVTILSGSLGAGKTTLLNRLLSGAGDRDVAVLVNDMGALNVDADLVSEESELTVADGQVTELSNGCICCELRDDLETAVVRLAQERSFDHLVVEPSGISEPAPVARLFTGGSPAAAKYRVDAVVAVVDSRLFADTFGPDGEPTETVAEGGDGERRPLSDLLVEQVEFADVVVLNKTDLVDDAERERVERVVRTLRPDARILATTYGDVAIDDVLGVDLFDPGAAAEKAGWKQALDAAEGADGDGTDGRGHGHSSDEHTAHSRDHHGHDSHGQTDQSHDGHEHANHADHEHTHPEDDYGITSFTYRRRRPFHPERIAAVLADLPASVLRSKGHLWVAGREETHLTFSQAGASASVEATGRWIASLPEFEQRSYRNNRSDLGYEWDETWGDRRTGLVFIGQDIDESALIDRLDDALLTDAEFEEEWETLSGLDRYPTEPGETVVLASPGE
ncbi:GTP-binding protein [Halobellus sp. Atlit-38R]|uniref:GTP-binding protein n=1 Tax=Halobellus sp. Atlit-38R TaxID=2282131 RepID=UPI000EF26425|nr:GTP-binding protein [Halobellus sp. Atlit-38R]RLM84132.1 GTP-binding protein [Halobellus sp. Atlit-38R]